MFQILVCLAAGAVLAAAASAQAQDEWVVYDGFEDPGSGKQVVLISGDEEYRSEEALPQLGKILAKHHGFACTVLFAINPKTGTIDPNYVRNIPGLHALDNADLMIIATRFRALPDGQMAHIDAYLKAGKPVIGLRTATHAFKPRSRSPYAHYGNGYDGPEAAWKGGFGRIVLGEQWVDHHGEHKHESTRGVIAPDAQGHPIVRGIAAGDIWGPSDVYKLRLPLPGDSMPIVLGEVMVRAGAFDEADRLYGMRPEDANPAPGEKNDPMMPVAWTRSYRIPGGEKGIAFTTTMGAATDFLSAGTRRMIVNAAYWCLHMEEAIPAAGAKADLVGAYDPTAYAFRDAAYWAERKMPVDEHRLKNQ